MRDLKSAKASKGDVEAAVKELLALKQQFKAETGIATLLALKLQVRSRYCHKYWHSRNSSRQKQWLPHCWHSNFSSEADIVTTARTQATV